MEQQTPGMETPISQPQTAPVESQPATTAPTEGLNPSIANRAAVYQQYYGAPEPEPPAPVQIPEPPTPVTATPSFDPSEIEAIKSELAALKAASTPKPPEPTAPTAEASWVDLLRQGEFEKAEQALINKAKAATAPDAIQQAVAETLELVKIQNGVENYLSKLRADNPDIVPMERYLRAPVEARIETAKQAGKIRSAEDFLKVYREAVDGEVSEMRKISQQYRAAGKTEALTTQRTVLSATPLSPNGVTLNREAPASEPQVETAADYLAKRMAKERMLKGLAN